MHLEYRQLLHLLEVSKAGSFSAAAASLNMSQPALSNSIAQLERKVRAKVLERGRNGTALTDAGQLLVRHAEILRAQMVRAIEDMRYREDVGFGTLRIGVTPASANRVVPRAVMPFRKRYPNVLVELHDITFQGGVAALLHNRLDFLVGPIGIHVDVPRIVERAFLVDPLVLALHKNHPLANRDTVSLCDLSQANWAMPNDDSAFRKQLESLFVAAGVTWPKLAVVTNSMTAMKSLVIHSDCIALMPLQLLELDLKIGLVDIIQVKDIGEPRKIGFVSLLDRPLSLLAEEFMELTTALANRHYCTLDRDTPSIRGSGAQPINLETKQIS